MGSNPILSAKNGVAVLTKIATPLHYQIALLNDMSRFHEPVNEFLGE